MDADSQSNISLILPAEQHDAASGNWDQYANLQPPPAIAPQAPPTTWRQECTQQGLVQGDEDVRPLLHPPQPLIADDGEMTGAAYAATQPPAKTALTEPLEQLMVLIQDRNWTLEAVKKYEADCRALLTKAKQLESQWLAQKKANQAPSALQAAASAACALALDKAMDSLAKERKLLITAQLKVEKGQLLVVRMLRGEVAGRSIMDGVEVDDASSAITRLARWAVNNPDELARGAIVFGLLSVGVAQVASVGPGAQADPDEITWLLPSLLDALG